MHQGPFNKGYEDYPNAYDGVPYDYSNSLGVPVRVTDQDGFQLGIPQVMVDEAEYQTLINELSRLRMANSILKGRLDTKQNQLEDLERHLEGVVQRNASLEEDKSVQIVKMLKGLFHDKQASFVMLGILELNIAQPIFEFAHPNWDKAYVSVNNLYRQFLHGHLEALAASHRKFEGAAHYHAYLISLFLLIRVASRRHDKEAEKSAEEVALEFNLKYRNELPIQKTLIRLTSQYTKFCQEILRHQFDQRAFAPTYTPGFQGYIPRLRGEEGEPEKEVRMGRNSYKHFGDY